MARISEAFGGDRALYRGLDDKMCRQLILDALAKSSLSKSEILSLLDRGALSANLSDEQKSKRVSNILQRMKNDGLIYPKNGSRYAIWCLKQPALNN